MRPLEAQWRDFYKALGAIEADEGAKSAAAAYILRASLEYPNLRPPSLWHYPAGHFDKDTPEFVSLVWAYTTVEELFEVNFFPMSRADWSFRDRDKQWTESNSPIDAQMAPTDKLKYFELP